jgi:hypothetical protein
MDNNLEFRKSNRLFIFDFLIILKVLVLDITQFLIVVFFPVYLVFYIVRRLRDKQEPFID